MKWLFLCLLFCSGCGVYRNNIDCPIGKGVNCVPVREILQRIEETNGSDDLFTDVHYTFNCTKGGVDASPRQ